MSTYRVFLGAPTAVDLRSQNKESTQQWQTVSSKQFTIGGALQRQGTSAASTSLIYSLSEPKYAASGSFRNVGTQSVILPLATLEAASHRISLIYKNVIFDDSADELENDLGGKDEDDRGNVVRDETTLITWPPTVPEVLNRTTNTTTNDDHNFTAPSFLLDTSKSHFHSGNTTRPDTQFETQETQSYNYSDASSIARFPSFHFALHSLTSLSSLSHKGSRKVNTLLAVLEVDGPDTIRIKKGADAGKEVAVLKLILGDQEGCICKLTAWREVAETWGGIGNAVGVKRGDVLYLENVTANWDSKTSPILTASTYLKSSAEICYRTMPYTHEDNRLRPDLRLGESDAAVRKVAAVVRWFEALAGLTGNTDNER